MASFTDLGDNVELQLSERRESVQVSISGTYNMIIALQREVGSPGSGVWAELDRFTTANATVDQVHVTQSENEKVRLIVLEDTSGTATATLSDVSDQQVAVVQTPAGDRIANWLQSGLELLKGLTVAAASTFTGAVTFNGLASFAASRSGPAPVDVTTATVTLTRAAHAGRPITLNRAAGIVVTLPDAIGSGDVYEIIVGTTFTGAAAVVAPDADNTFQGNATLFQDSGDTVVGFAAAPATTDTLDLFETGNTTGGIAGARAVFKDIAADLWQVDYVSDAGGTEATPFAATVS